MTDRAVLIPTAEGPVGGIVSVPAAEPRGALVLLAGYGRPARSGVDSFWTRFARDCAERGLLTLRFDYSREGETLPLGEGGTGQIWKRDLDLRLLEQVVSWLRLRTGDLPLSLAGICSGARLAIELAGREPDAIAATLLLVPHLRELPQPAAEGTPQAGALDTVDPVVVECMRKVLGHAPSWILCGERDDPDLGRLQALLGPTPQPLQVDIVPGAALHMLDRPELHAEVRGRMLDRLGLPR